MTSLKPGTQLQPARHPAVIVAMHGPVGPRAQLNGFGPRSYPQQLSPGQRTLILTLTLNRHLGLQTISYGANELITTARFKLLHQKLTIRICKIKLCTLFPTRGDLEFNRFPEWELIQ